MSQSKSDTGIVNPELQDAQRRQSLKVIGAGIAAPLGVLSGGSLAVAADEVLQPRTKKEFDTKSATHAHDIELHLYSSRNVVEDSLLIRNKLDKDLVLKKVSPSLLVFNDRYLDLRSLIGDTPLTLAPGHTVSFMVYSQPLYGRAWSQTHNAHAAEEAALSDGTSYLWAQNSINVITDDTILVSAAALVVDETAILYTKPKQSMARRVQLT